MVKGKVITCDGPRYYTVKVSYQNYIWRRHIDQLREREVICDNNGVSDEQVINPSENSDDLNLEVPDFVHVNSANSGDSDDVEVTSIGDGNQDTTHMVMSESQEVSEKNDISNSATINTDSNNINNSNNVRRSKRIVKRPSRYC